MQSETVLCGGCFNRVHEGHVYFLRQAKALGKRLVVVIANDANNKKPYARPASERALSIRGLGIADEVIIGNSGNIMAAVLEIKPQIIALGYDQVLPEDVSEKIKKLGIRLQRIKKHGGFSTSALESGKD
jgi:FAD synthetase